MTRRGTFRLKPAVLGLESRAVPSAIAPATPGFGVGTPFEVATPQELSRERFAARFTRVQVGVGAPQSSDQARQFLYAGSGISNQFLQGRLVMRLFTPIDLVNGRVTGMADLRDRSIATSGAGLVLDLTGSPADLDALGRPTHLTWTVNGNVSGGAFTGSVAANPDGTTENPDGSAATGSLDIVYAPNPAHAPHRPGINGGSATAIFSGAVRTNEGVTDITRFELGHF